MKKFLFIVLIFCITYTSGITVNLTNQNVPELKKEVFQQYNIEEIEEIILEPRSTKLVQEDTFIGMTNLKVLEINLHNTDIYDLPKNIFLHLTSLEKLAISFSKFTTLHENIFSTLTKLKKLYLHHNSLQSLPEKIFENLIELEEVILHHNKDLANIPKNLFAKNPKINLLWLDNNKLSEIHPDTFKNNLELVYFTLYENKIQEIKRNTFSHLQNLYGINLYENEITNIEIGAFPTNNMTFITLGKNKLNYLDPQIVLDLKETEDVTICPNPWKCDENLLPLWKIFQEHYSSKLEDCTCEEPKSLKGRTWDTLHEEDFK